MTEHNDDAISVPIGTSLEEMERQLLVATLAKFDGNKVRTAEAMGISLKTVYNLMEKHGLRRPVLVKVMRDV
jgi:DNA-binding NtrC family response regulator